MGLQSNVNSVLGTAGGVAKAVAPGQIEMPKPKSLEQRQTDANKRAEEKLKALTNQRQQAMARILGGATDGIN